MILLGQYLPIGSVIHSMLTEAQFQAEAGSGWVLANGQTVTGSRYATITGASTVPDMTGRFLRGKGANNPDGDLALGTYTADKFKSHNHSGNYLSTATGDGTRSGYASDIYYDSVYSVISGTTNVTPDGGNETAPKSITVNIFIRIN